MLAETKREGIPLIFVATVETVKTVPIKTGNKRNDRTRA